MSVNDINDPISRSISGVSDLVTSKTNKVGLGGGGNDEGVQGEEVDVLDLEMTDDELLRLAENTKNKYKGYETKIKARQDANLKYYLGQQKPSSQVTEDGAPISANLIFESEEIFLAAALSKNPEPVVYADNTDEGNKVSSEIKTMLQYHAETQNLRAKLTLATRGWTLDFLSAIKIGWDATGDVKIEYRDIKKFIFDPEGYVDTNGDFVGMLGEMISSTAQELSDMFPAFAEHIAVICNGKMGTTVVRTEWWNDEYTFTTFEGKVLDKSKNPHFNYEENKSNHFARPKKPYAFLSVFSIQSQPHDLTGLIEQVIPNQNRVTRRTEQLDYNLSRANNSDAFSADNFNQETAKQAANAMRKGNPIIVPSGRPISEAIHRFPTPTVGGEFFKALETDKGDVRSIYGVQGITAQPQDDDQTARGMILNQQYDNTRIGGGIGDKLEVMAKNVFNYLVQMYYVYYDEQHFAAVLGQMKATEYVVLSSANLKRKVIVSVSPNSMKPKDETTMMNQSLALYEAKALDIKTLLTMLDYPDPQKTAAQVWLYQNNPMAYAQLNFPEMMRDLQAMGSGQPVGGDTEQPGQPNPEAVTEPAPSLGGVNASPSLSMVALPK